MIAPTDPQTEAGTTDPHRNDEYFKQLGMLVSAFAHVESYLFICLILTSGMKLEVGRAILSGTRAKEAVGFMRRTFAIKQFPGNLVEVMEACFEQIVSINDVSNNLIHHGTDLREEQLKTTNALRAHLPERAVVYNVDFVLLHNISQDLVQISKTLGHCTNMLLGKTPDAIPEAVTKTERRSWLYKSHAQASKGRKTPENDQRQKPRPRSSQE